METIREQMSSDVTLGVGSGCVCGCGCGCGPDRPDIPGPAVWV